MIAHDEEPEVFEKISFLEELLKYDMNFTMEAVQAYVLTKIGFLLGSHGGAFNQAIWQEAFPMVPELEGIEVEFRWEPIKLDNKRVIAREGVRAVHVHTSHGNSGKARNIFLKLCSSHNNRLPLGMKFRFIPDTMNNKFPLTKKGAEMARRGKKKQKQFLSETEVSSLVANDAPVPLASRLR